MLTVAGVEISTRPDALEVEVVKVIVACYDLVEELRQAADASEFRIAGLLVAAPGPVAAPTAGYHDEPGERVRPENKEE